jgi:DNA-directed RNA polymerase alpha subunit
MVIGSKEEIKALLDGFTNCGAMDSKTANCILHLSTVDIDGTMASVNKIEHDGTVGIQLNYYIGTGDKGHISILAQDGNCPIRELQISVRLYNLMCKSLRRYGISESTHNAILSDFTKVTERQLLDIRGFGKLALIELRDVLDVAGLKLKDD